MKRRRILRILLKRLVITWFLLIAISSFICAQTDQEDLLIIEEAAKKYVDNNSVPGIKYSLKLLKKTDKSALLQLHALQHNADDAMVIMVKKGNNWIGEELGTDPDILNSYKELKK